MSIEKVRHGGAGMIAGSIVNHDDMTPRLSQHVAEKSRIAFRVQTSLMRFVEKLSGKGIDQSKDFVALALATRGHCGLLACGRPGIAERAPLGKAGFSATEQQGLRCRAWRRIRGHLLWPHSRRLASL